MAPGSQKWNGSCADFVTAPTMTSTSAVVRKPSCGMSAVRISLNSAEPAPTWSMTMPTSIASPPKVVTSSACIAAPREGRRPV
jgi:hypothetical protein